MIIPGCSGRTRLERGRIVKAGAGCLVGAGGEKAFENEDGGDLIDDGAMLLTGFAHGVQLTVGLAGGEALIGEVDGEAEGGAELFGEGLGLEGLRTYFSGHVEGIADDELRDVVFAQEAANGLEIRVGGAAMEGKEGLDGEAERIGDGETDAFAADIEGEEARGKDGGRRVGMGRWSHGSSLAAGAAVAKPRSL